MADFAQRSLRIFLNGIQYGTEIFYLSKKNRLPAIKDPLLLKPVTELTTLIHSRKLKCETLIRAYIQRINEVNPLINAVVVDRFNEAIAEAKEYDRKIEEAFNNPEQKNSVLDLPLLGIPVTIKECLAVKGLPCTGGLFIRKNRIMSEDAAAVKKLKDNGVIILGITNNPEMLFWWDSDNYVYGRTNNPYDLARISGGSSGGEAAIVGAAGSVFGVGSDIGGSLRIPVLFCGVFSHKSSPFLVPGEGQFPSPGHKSRESLFAIGPICRYACDLRFLFKNMINDSDPKIFDKLRLDEPVDLKKCKFYFLMNDGDPLKSKVSSDILDSLEKVKHFFQNDCQFNCEDIKLPLMRYSFFMFLARMGNCDAPPLAEELTERNGSINGYWELLKSFMGLSIYRKTTLLNVIGENLFLSPKAKRRNAFLSIIEKTEKLRQDVYKLLDDDSILIMPTLPEPAPKHNGTFLRCMNVGYTGIINVLELPATQVSMGLGKKSRMPVGFQVIAKNMNDRLTLAVAELLSKEFGGWQPPCDINISS